eukprot:6821927-Alexandrium_andersonii.AAC.1
MLRSDSNARAAALLGASAEASRAKARHFSSPSWHSTNNKRSVGDRGSTLSPTARRKSPRRN